MKLLNISQCKIYQAISFAAPRAPLSKERVTSFYIQCTEFQRNVVALERALGFWKIGISGLEKHRGSAAPKKEFTGYQRHHTRHLLHRMTLLSSRFMHELCQLQLHKAYHRKAIQNYCNSSSRTERQGTSNLLF